MTKKVQFRTEEPLIQYHQKLSNGCCLSSLASSFHCMVDNRSVYVIVNRIEESLTPQIKECKNRIHFANYIMKNRRRIKGEHNLQYNMTIWKKHYSFDILNDISADVNLLQLMESLVNANRAISILGYWIFDSNYEKALCLTQGLLDIVCSPSVVK